MTIECLDFGKTAEGIPVSIFTLKNRNGVEARITEYGGILVSLKTPDRSGRFSDIVLGFDSLEGYLNHPKSYFGALIGRYANRIGHARFRLEGVEYVLERNDGLNTLHGGTRGFDKRLWKARNMPDEGIELSYVSRDGECGFPGTLSVSVTYMLSAEDELSIRYSATTDRTTVVNLTNHAYFNLKDCGASSILDHKLEIHADSFTPVTEEMIPTGEYRQVPNTVFDFRTPLPIGSRIGGNEEQLVYGRGYDHNWVLRPASGGLSMAARVEEPSTGRILEVHTTQPGLQFYSGNFLDGTIRGKGGVRYEHRSGFCLETQHFPDSPNKPEFPTTMLRTGQRFSSLTVLRFLRSA